MSDGRPSDGELKQYALVSYLPEPLGSFLTTLRAELVPGCHLRSHVTLLPPRWLGSPVQQLVRELESALQALQPFEIAFGGVEVFDSTNVVYLAIAGGAENLRSAHLHMNAGGLAFPEPYPYHPHITLAQDFPVEQLSDIRRRAGEAWQTWRNGRACAVEQLTFVTSPSPWVWETISEHSLEPRMVSPLR